MGIDYKYRRGGGGGEEVCACMRSWVVVVVRRAPFSSPPRRPSAAASPGPPALLTSPRSTPRPSSSRPRGGTCRCRTRASASSSWRCEPVREGGGREGQARSSVGDVGGRRRGGRTHVPFFARVAAALRRRSSSLWTCSSWPLAPPCERIDRHWSVASLGGGGETGRGGVSGGRSARADRAWARRTCSRPAPGSAAWYTRTAWA